MVFSHDRENERVETTGSLLQWKRFVYAFVCLFTMASLFVNSKGIYEIFTGKKCEVGVQTETLPDTNIVRYTICILRYPTLTYSIHRWCM